MSIFRRVPPIGWSLFEGSVQTETEDLPRGLTLEFDHLFETWTNPVYAYILSICGNMGEAEELTQEVFLRLYSQLKAGKQLKFIRSWVFRVAHNLAINRAIRSRHEVPTNFSEWIDSGAEPQDATLDPEQLYKKQEQEAQLLQGLRSLTDHQRRCLQLRAENFAYREIAEILNVTVASVSDALDRAIRKLRQNSHA